MKPKEKAKDLVRKMKFATDEFGYININMERHKQCALIAVDEIINEYFDKCLFSKCDYWQEVKQEIKLL